MTGKINDVNYKPVAEDPEKSCVNCEHFQAKDEKMGECFGHKVSAKGTCNYFKPKNKNNK